MTIMISCVRAEAPKSVIRVTSNHCNHISVIVCSSAYKLFHMCKYNQSTAGWSVLFKSSEKMSSFVRRFFLWRSLRRLSAVFRRINSVPHVDVKFPIFTRGRSDGHEWSCCVFAAVSSHVKWEAWNCVTFSRFFPFLPFVTCKLF